MTDPTRLPAGREMDALVAEKKMGWSVCRDPECKGCECSVLYESGAVWLVVRPGGGEWRPSTDIEAAWEVFETLPDGSWITKPRPDAPEPTVGRQWEVGVPTDCAPVVRCADTAPLAICRAALAAVRAERKAER